jgi:hypothetical protein
MDGTEDREPIMLGGRAFVTLARTTLEHDHWYMHHARTAGLDAVEPHDGETHAEYALRLLSAALGSGRALLLLGGLIVPADAPGGRWTPELAVETAAFLRGLDDPIDKHRINGLMAAMLADFFAAGLISSGASPLSSDGQPVAVKPTDPTSPGASGPTSFGRSPATTRTARAPSTAGPWWRRLWPFARSGAARRSTTTAIAASCGP